MPPPFPPPGAVKNTDSGARAFEGVWAALDKSTLLLVALVCANELFPKPEKDPSLILIVAGHPLL
jgi:hypothetical protein